MNDPNINQAVTQLMDQVLIWIGFGTLVGLVAKAIMPGRDPGGAVATLVMGIAGSVIGCAVLMYLTDGKRISPISPIGFLVGTAGTFVILAIYRLLSGYFFVETGTVRRPQYAGFGTRRRRRAPREIIYED